VIRKDLNSSSLTIPKPYWESYCYKVADLIVSEQAPARVMEVRGKFYEPLSHCMPPTVILKVRHSSCILFLALATPGLRYSKISFFCVFMDGRVPEGRRDVLGGAL
jgi:hypothetical protein